MPDISADLLLKPGADGSALMSRTDDKCCSKTYRTILGELDATSRFFCSTNLAQCFGLKADEAISLETNFVRDCVWGIISQLNCDAGLKPTASEWGQWEGQQLYSTLGMAVYLIFYSRRKKDLDKDACISLFAACCAIGPWDYFQYKGATDWLPSCLSTVTCCGNSNNTAQLWASMFPGLAEGPTQFLVTKLGKLLLKQDERDLFMKDPKAYLSRFLVDLGIAATWGSVPGNIWQLVFAACVAAKLSPIVTGFFIAAAVMTGNYIFAKNAEKMGDWMLSNLNALYERCNGSYDPLKQATLTMTAPLVPPTAAVLVQPISNGADGTELSATPRKGSVHSAMQAETPLITGHYKPNFRRHTRS